MNPLVSAGFLLFVSAIFAEVATPCAMFALSKDGVTLFANNEDFTKPGYVWFTSKTEGKLGRIHFGFSDRFTQGGMNEEGLCFDAAEVPEVPCEPDPGKKNTKNLLDKILDECATVGEAKLYFEEYNCWHLSRGQFLFADRFGDSMVVSCLPNRGLTFTERAGDFQIITNLRNEASGFRCERYVLAERLLKSENKNSIELARDVLAAIHQEGEQAFTSYSNIFDPVNRKAYVYNLANYDEVVVFDLAEELAKGDHTTPLTDLFKTDRKISDVRDVPVRVFVTEVQVDPILLEGYAGEYVSEEPSAVLTFEVDGNGLVMKSNQSKPAHLFPESETSFRIREGGLITFDVAEDGTARGFTLHRYGDHYAKRR